MECGHCIFERLRNEGMWDRFGTTVDQEIEAMCMKHILESKILNTDWPNSADYIAKLDAEIERRKV